MSTLAAKKKKKRSSSSSSAPSHTSSSEVKAKKAKKRKIETKKQEGKRQEKTEEREEIVVAADDQDIMWQWKTDTGRWNSYDSHSGLSIEKAYQRKERTTVLNCSFGSYTIDFNKMKQINNTTGFKRKIRRHHSSSSTATSTSTSTSTTVSAMASTDEPFWEYEIAENKWEAYDRITNRIIEGSLASGRRSVTLNHGQWSADGGCHVIDFTNLTQTKQSSNETIRVRRTPQIATQIAKDSGAQIEEEKGFDDPDKSVLKKVAKLAQWSLVEDKLDSDDTCPICLGELEVNVKENKEQEREKEKGKRKRRAKRRSSTHRYNGSDVVRLSKCIGHYFHVSCIVPCYQSGFLQCPICNVVYGTRVGNMPVGTMSVHQYPKGACPCSGYEKYGTIQIDYSFPSGVQGPEHPNPGSRYSGTSRTAYLPDNSDGRQILKLFQIAWERKLLFTVGRSVTTGRDNTVVWAGIHHKTCTHGGATNFGYPDETYFSRVKEELANKGVIPEEEEEEEEKV